jgi:hypothetical protein
MSRFKHTARLAAGLGVAAALVPAACRLAPL